MDMFTRFNRKSIQERQIDSLIGLSKGLTADGIVNQAEAEFLHSWLVQNWQASDNPIVLNLLSKLDAMLADGVLDAEESSELLAILQSFSGGKSELGELAKTCTLPINQPQPPIIFDDSLFLFTGTCAFGTRKQCQEAVLATGGVNAKGISQKLNYLVLGSYVTDSWVHESFGRKIERAMDYRDHGVPLAIITEEHWADEAGF